MRTVFSLVLFWLCGWSMTVWGGTEPSTRFVEATQAYDAKNFNAAIQAYQAILESGTYSVEVLYNLGNAHFRKGESGLAMLRYQQAHRTAPSDPDVRANIAYVQQKTGAILPELTNWKRPFLSISGSVWSVLALVLLWSFCLFLVLAVWVPRYRAGWLKAALWTALAGLTCMAGLYQHHQRFRADQVVILDQTVEALFAPLEGATPHFALPEASLADVVERNGSWVKVRSGKEEGWIQQSTCAKVYPWY